MTPIARALGDRARGLLTCLLLAVAVLGGIAALGTATATTTARTSVSPAITPAPGSVRAPGRPGPATAPKATHAPTSASAVETGRATTSASADRLALSAARPSAQHGPLSQVVGDLPNRRGSPSNSVSAFGDVDQFDAVSAVEPSPAAARAPPRSA